MVKILNWFTPETLCFQEKNKYEMPYEVIPALDQHITTVLISPVRSLERSK